MLTNRKYRFDDIPEDVLTENIIDSIQYVNKKNIHEENTKDIPLFTSEYDDEHGLTENISEIKENIELKSFRILDIVAKVCEILQNNKDEILLKRVDGLRIMHNGFIVVSLQNKNGPGNDKYIMLRLEGISYLCEKYREELKRKQYETYNMTILKISVAFMFSTIIIKRYL
jgi:hypothetical protein